MFNSVSNKEPIFECMFCLKEEPTIDKLYKGLVGDTLMCEECFKYHKNKYNSKKKPVKTIIENMINNTTNSYLLGNNMY